MAWFAALRPPLQYAIIALCEIVSLTLFILLITSSANEQASGPGTWIFAGEIAARCLTAGVYVFGLLVALIFGLHAWQALDRQKQGQH